VLGWATWLQRRAAEAVTAFEKALGLSREAFSLAFIGHIYGRLGRKDEVKLILRELDQLFGQGRVPPIAFVMIHAGLGDADAAFDWLETACQLRDDKLFWLKAMPMFFDPLPSDPRFAGIVRRVGLAPPLPGANQLTGRATRLCHRVGQLSRAQWPDRVAVRRIKLPRVPPRNTAMIAGAGRPPEFETRPRREPSSSAKPPFCEVDTAAHTQKYGQTLGEAAHFCTQ
jgi:hypothetical protein